MKTIRKILILLIVGISYLYPQEVNDKKPLTLNDSVQVIQSEFYKFELFYNLNNTDINLPVYDNPNTINLWTSYAVSNTASEESPFGKSPSYMLTPLYIKYINDSKMETVKYVLGMAQTAAVGYMAYSHIKKYGFWK